MENWDDLRFLLAVYKAGTMTAAARTLGTNVATVSRRIERLAQDLGSAPFIKTPAGWRPSHQALLLIEAAAAFEGSLERERNSAAARVPLQRPRIRMAAPALVAETVLLPRIGGVGDTPGPLERVEMELGRRQLEIGLGSYDLAVQSERPDSGRLVVRHIGRLSVRPWTWDGAGDTPNWAALIHQNDDDPGVARAIRAFNGGPSLRVETTPELCEAAQRLRLGAVLPDVLAAGIEGLRPADDLPPDSTDFWLLHHQSRRGDPAIELVADWIAACFRDIEDQTAGDGGG